MQNIPGKCYTRVKSFQNKEHDKLILNQSLEFVMNTTGISKIYLNFDPVAKGKQQIKAQF